MRGPTAPEPISTPSTVSESREKDGFVVGAEPPNPPPFPEGITPENDVSVRTRPALAAATPCSDRTFATPLAARPRRTTSSPSSRKRSPR